MYHNHENLFKQQLGTIFGMPKINVRKKYFRQN